MEQQITTFQKAWKLLADGGVWITEDTATSYDLAMGAGTTVNSGQFGGGYGKSSTWCALPFWINIEASASLSQSLCCPAFIHSGFFKVNDSSSEMSRSSKVEPLQLGFC
jgi:hypothetical protein